MSTSDSSADVTVIIDGLVSDSTNPVLPAALFFKKQNFLLRSMSHSSVQDLLIKAL